MAYYKRLRDMREDHDLTQKEVAEKLYMHTTQYRRYESGERTVPLDTAVALCHIYNVSLDYLAGLSPFDTNISENNLSQEEKTLITNYRRLNEFEKGRINERIESILE